MGYLNIDLNPSAATDYIGNVKTLPCHDSSVDEIATFHMIEHIAISQVKDVLAEWRRVLRDGGRLVVECPDFDRIAQLYLDGEEDRIVGIFGHQRFPGDTHLWGYNVKRLTELLTHSGFVNIRSVAPQDYHKETWPCIRIEADKGNS